MKNQDLEHVVVVPGKKPKTYTVGRSRFYELSSFGLIGGYRFFSSVKEINRIIEEEKPDVVELGGNLSVGTFSKKKELPSICLLSCGRQEGNRTYASA